MLRQFFVMLLVSVMGFSAAIEHAEARRLGGGSSMGSASRAPLTARPVHPHSNRLRALSNREQVLPPLAVVVWAV